MKNFKQYLRQAVLGLSAITVVTVFALGGTVQARTKYDPNGTATSATPVFNHFYDVPSGVGDEADFVRVKPKAGGNGDYVSTLNDACNTGSTFNVRTYVHNGADPSQNGNGNGSAVAHDVVVRMTAPLNKVQSSFKFDSTISASNAASVSDSATLNCNGKTVKLSLVANSVQTYAKPIGFQTVPDSSVNGSLKIGSRVQGSGDVWGCWDDRVIVVYEVKVEEAPKPVVGDGVCKANDLKVIDNKSRKVRVTVNGATTGQGASIVGYEINWGDGSKSTKQTDEHTYAKDGTYTVRARVQVKLPNGETKWVESVDCTKVVTFKADVPPTVTPPTPVTPPTGELIKTGPASLAGIFAGTSALSAAAHRIVTRRRNRI